jgi:putative ABC transport system substrate-binding protein
MTASSEQLAVISKTGANPMVRSIFICLLLTVFLLTVTNAEAQRAAKEPPRVGVLLALPYSTISDRIEAFGQGLRHLGYVEGKTILVDYRYADGKFERLPELASALLRSGVKIIVTGGPTATRPAKDVTATIPIVMARDSDPVGNGFVNSLARPGGNITGLSNYAPELSGKQLELLKEIVPRLSRVAVLGNSNEPGNRQALRETQLAAEYLRVRIQSFDVRVPKEIDRAFQAAKNQRADAVLVLSSPVVASHRKRIAELAVQSRLPAIYQVRDSVEAGGLMTYGVSITDLWRRAATYVDKILKGAKPADLPVEQPTKFELFINLKAAKQIGLTIPPNVLARANRVIK